MYDPGFESLHSEEEKGKEGKRRDEEESEGEGTGGEEEEGREEGRKLLKPLRIFTQGLSLPLSKSRTSVSC